MAGKTPLPLTDESPKSEDRSETRTQPAPSLPCWQKVKTYLKTKPFLFLPLLVTVLWWSGFSPVNLSPVSPEEGSVSNSDAAVQRVGPVVQSYGFSTTAVFSFVETSHNQGPNQARTTGEIHVKPGAEDLDSKVWVEISSYVSDPRLTRCQGGTPSESGLVFESITNCPTPGDYGDLVPELYVYPTIYIARDVTLENLNITTDSLSIHFDPGLKLNVSNTTSILARGSGTVTMPPTTDSQPGPLYSRETIIEVRSGSVTGMYALYDLLRIQTSSGSISISIALKNASTSAVKPASLDLSASSGSIRAHTHSLSAYSSVPDRDYQTTVRSSSGSVEVSLVHGTQTALHSRSGSLQASLYPYGPNATRSDIRTDSQSGRTEITVHPALVNSTDPLRRLYGSYSYRSGSFELSYPPKWEGTVEGLVSSGSIDIDWDGLDIVEDRKEWTGRRVKGVKGDGEGVLGFRGSSGSARLSGDSW